MLNNPHANFTQSAKGAAEFRPRLSDCRGPASDPLWGILSSQDLWG